MHTVRYKGKLTLFFSSRRFWWTQQGSWGSEMCDKTCYRVGDWNTIRTWCFGRTRFVKAWEKCLRRFLCCWQKATFTARESSPWIHIEATRKIRHCGQMSGVKIESWPVASPWPWFEEKWRSSPCWSAASPEECSRLSFSAGSRHWMTSWHRRRFLWRGWPVLRREKRRDK